ncbi:toprim domain-containing protein [Chryseobacterium balustinum]|uniref:Toprim-like n=1 Tax=Chryseobacterium balustinum TaxID=246 RepID=A0AAX2IR51_9FLAO|nr:toprim domain-containing protein [Chryseobacterium balustinum]AZB32118.1 hypothetical protein EB354_22830 [Chryseobacterium balustinum]SKB94009.1 Toprim-like [Chryseobacterium balustinum]SQA92273.1 Uncharacterised protein [Chryseobacterium balustinum]
MNYTLDWDRIKREVDIEQYFLFKMGSLYSFDKYKKAYVLESNNQHGDIIRFFRHEKSGVKMYYSIMNQDSGDIIQFIKKRILNNTSASALEINKELRSFLCMGDIESKISSSKTYFAHASEDIEPIQYEINGDIIPKINLHLEYLEHYRKLHKNIFLSGVFQSTLFTYKKDNTISLSYFVKDIKNEVVGIHRVFTGKGDYFNKKWFDTNSKNSIGFTFSEKPAITETLSIFESIFDAMSYAQIFNPENTQYCSSNGELSFSKAQNIEKYFTNNAFIRLVLGNDSDVSGVYFNLNIVAAFIKEIQHVRKTTETIILDIVSVEQKNFNILKQFFRRLDEVPTNFKDKDLEMTYFTETLSQNSTKFIFIIGNTKDSIQFFVGLLLKIWKLDEFVRIHQPFNKDFNEDLIQQKSLSNE